MSVRMAKKSSSVDFWKRDEVRMEAAGGARGRTGTHVPEVGPRGKIRVVHLPLGVDVLTRADEHLLGRGNVDQGRRSGVRMGHPDGNGEAVGRAPEGHGQRARQVDQEGGRPIDEG